MIRFRWILLITVCLLLAACGGGGSEEGAGASSSGTAGDVQRGKELYNRTVIGSNAAPGCVTCHSLEEGIKIVGPSMAGIAQEAGERVPNQSAEEYLHLSIVEPDAFVVEDYPAGLMYQRYEQDLTEQEINDLVAFLMTLK